jgi:long-chain acyl-CoA synthetase
MSETIVSMFRRQVRLSGGRPALRTKRAGRWVTTPWAEWGRRARNVARALVDSGVEPGDRVAIAASTREEWAITDAGVLLAGAVTVPMYPSLGAEDVAHILRDSGAKVAFVDDETSAARLFSGAAEAARPALVIAFDAARGAHAAGRPALPTLDELERRGAAALERAESAAELDARGDAVRPEDLASILYTSGTSGRPKGVMLTHAAFAHEVRSIGPTFGIGPTDEQLLFLPLAHVFGRVLLIAQIRIGFASSFAESPLQALENMAEVNPTFFASVPRLFEKVHQLTLERAAREGPVRERLFRWAMHVGAEVSRARRAGRRVDLTLAAQHRYADKLVLSKVRSVFGSRLRVAISGAAPLASELAEWLHATGVLVLEAYGLTETTAGATANRQDRFRFGSVGAPLDGVEVRIANDGEILLRGGNVTRGYWNDPAATAEAIDDGGWLHTGDVGALGADGLLEITDRKKDILVTAGGRNIAPQKIERMLRESPWISQALVVGDKRPHLVALVALESDAVRRWAAEQNLAGLGSLDALARDADVRGLIEVEIDLVNRRLASFEAIRRFSILPDDLSIERGELTPTLKVRRRAVEARYRAEIERLYRS